MTKRPTRINYTHQTEVIYIYILHVLCALCHPLVYRFCSLVCMPEFPVAHLCLVCIIYTGWTLCHSLVYTCYSLVCTRVLLLLTSVLYVEYIRYTCYTLCHSLVYTWYALVYGKRTHSIVREHILL